MSTNRAGRFSKPPHSAALPPLRGRIGLERAAEFVEYSIKRGVVRRQFFFGRNFRFHQNIWPLLTSKGVRRLSARVPPRRDGKSSISVALHIECQTGLAASMSEMRLPSVPCFDARTA